MSEREGKNQNHQFGDWLRADTVQAMPLLPLYTAEWQRRALGEVEQRERLPERIILNFFAWRCRGRVDFHQETRLSCRKRGVVDHSSGSNHRDGAVACEETTHRVFDARDRWHNRRV